jgi:hypothetical protein
MDNILWVTINNVRHGKARCGAARPGAAWPGSVRQGMTGVL